MRAVAIVVLLGVLVGVSVAARADIVIFRDGSYKDDGKILSVSEQELVLETKYGQEPYPTIHVYWYGLSDPSNPGLAYYQAGVKILELHKKGRAEDLFTKAGAYDKQYATAGRKALRDYSPHESSDATAARLRMPQVTEHGQQVPTFVIVCPLCEGTGQVEYEVIDVASLDGFYHLRGVA